MSGASGAASLGELGRLLESLDGHGYRSYKKIKGSWPGEDFSLHIEHVQGDPFAIPSRVRLHLPSAVHGIPDDAWSTTPRRTGLADFLLRTFKRACEGLPRTRGSGKSGLVVVSVDSPIVVQRAGCSIDGGGVTLRFRVGLPASGRRCRGRSAAELFTRHLPRALEAVRWAHLDQGLAWSWIRTTEDHDHIQGRLKERGLVAFVRDGSILPRESGVSSDPLPDAIPFESPPELRVTLETLHHGAVVGMGIPTGLTVVTGGGFHGKTTLLEALQFGVFPHAPGDGREWVVTVADAVKVRSEDGRAVSGVDLRPFIHDLPLARGTASFSTADASGSTSLAADIVEALEAGTSLLMMDEDTCATNLMVRDARMQELVERETITPLIDRVHELLRLGVSTVLVTGGGGDYLDVSDTVLLMEEYRAHLVTETARRVAASHPTGRRIGEPDHPLVPTHRVPRPESFDPRRRDGRIAIKTRGADTIQFGRHELDLGAVEQLTDYGQARAIGAMLAGLRSRCDGTTPVRGLVIRIVGEAREKGLIAIESSPELAMPRAQDLAKAVNRLRTLRIVTQRK